MPHYTILRSLGRSRTAEAFNIGRRLTATDTARRAESSIESAELRPRDVRDLARDPDVVGIAPVMPTRLIAPVDVGAAAVDGVWGIAAVGADRSAFTGTGVRVAVLDTGIDASHEAFRGVDLVQQDFSGTGNGDRNGHGTHCAGTIFGRPVGGTRIGIAPGVTRALIGKVLADNGSGTSEAIFRGIQWAAQEGAHVISMSLGFDFPGLVDRLASQEGWPVDLATSAALEAYRGNLRMFDALMEMIDARAAFGSGTVVCAAAGNESRRQDNESYEVAVSIPAAADDVVSVGALAESPQGLKVAPFSNTFPQISAPGVAILSAKAGGGLASLSGTSMATPHVAGVTALWWEAVARSSARPSGTTVHAKLLASARTAIFAPGVDEADRGVGIVTAP